LVKAVAAALMAVPAAHVAWGEDALTQFHSADIAVAVATPGGLITPIVRAAQTKGLAAIAQEVQALAARARAGSLKAQEYQGGSFTLSNLGMYGVERFSAIINPPQALILAVGAGEPRVVAVDGAPAVRTVMSVTLSADHRAVDGAVAAQWLSAFKRFVENPVEMLA
jgi:pyruvate dehydrogenase E2 component (dihydrolipoamide acetyltransferase)